MRFSLKRKSTFTLHSAFCTLHLPLVLLPHSEQNRSESFPAERNQGIKVLAFAVDGFVGGEEDDHEGDSDKEAPYSENAREDQQHSSQEFEGVAELV